MSRKSLGVSFWDMVSNRFDGIDTWANGYAGGITVDQYLRKINAVTDADKNIVAYMDTLQRNNELKESYFKEDFMDYVYDQYGVKT